MIAHLLASLGYVKARCGEPTTWAGIVGACAAAQALTGFLLYLALFAGVVAVLVKEPGK